MRGPWGNPGNPAKDRDVPAKDKDGLQATDKDAPVNRDKELTKGKDKSEKDKGGAAKTPLPPCQNAAPPFPSDQR